MKINLIIIIISGLMLNACGIGKRTFTEDVPYNNIYVNQVIESDKKSGNHTVLTDSSLVHLKKCFMNKSLVDDESINLGHTDLVDTGKTFTYNTALGSSRTVRVYNVDCSKNKVPKTETVEVWCGLWWLDDKCNYDGIRSLLAFPLFPFDYYAWITQSELNDNTK